MNTYLIAYGADNSFFVCEADDHGHAIEQFNNWSDEQEGEINAVWLCTELKPFDREGVAYARGTDGSYFHVNDLSVTIVPPEMSHDADRVEEYFERADTLGDEE